ncbi:MAG: hypothetical protein H6696_20865, partial [Deferribacteres bacterium]|nr:hypothetical protein [Deferribacteres bacterium]
MKKRKLLIWTTLIVVLAVVLGVAAWHLWEVEKRIEFAIRSKIDVAFSDKLQVGDINLAFGRLHLSDIRYQFEVSPLLLSISDISISYNILSFIKAGFKFEQTSNEIIITAPAITYILRENGVAANKVTREQISELLKNQYQTAIKSIEFINSATVSNGSVFIIDSLSYARTGESKTYAVVQGVNGWIETQKDGKAFTRLAGRFFNSKNYSAKVVGTADLSQGTLDSLIVQLVDYKFERQLLTEFPEYLTNVDGKINGFLKLQENARGPGYDLSGKIRVSDGEMDLEAANLFIDDLDIESRLDNFDFIIDHGEFTLNDSKVKIAGSIQNLLAPQLLVDVYSPEIDLQKFAYRLSPQSPFPINGKGKVHLAIRESIQSPQFSGFFIADTLSIINRPVQDIRIEMSFRDSTLYLDEVRAQFLHSKIESWGELAFNKARRPLNMHLVAEGEFLDNLEDIFPFAIPSNFGAVDAELFGPLDSPVLRGNYSFTVSAKDRNPLDLLGHFTIDDWNLNFGAGTMDRKFQASGAITNLAEHALYQIHIENIGHILTPLGVQPISQIADRYSIDANLNGIREDMNLELSGYNFQSNSTHFTSTFRLTQKNPNLSKIAGTIQILPKTPYALATNFKANLTDTSIVFTQLGNQHWFDGRCKIDLREEKAIDAEFRVSNLELDQVVPKNDDGTTKLSGKLLSQVQIKGDLHKPEIKAETWMLGAKYNGIGVLSAHVKVALEDNNVHIENVSLSRNNIPLVRSAGWVNISPFAVNFDLIAQDLDMN